jgi:translation initiation factor IF-2
MVTTGKIYRNSGIRIIREGVVIFTGQLTSLKRFKDDVKEVSKGYDCGLQVKNYNDIKVGDVLECFQEVAIKKSL